MYHFDVSKNDQTNFSQLFVTKLYSNLLSYFKNAEISRKILKMNLSNYLLINNDSMNLSKLKKYFYKGAINTKEEVEENGSIFVSFHYDNFIVTPALISHFLKKKLYLLIDKENMRHISYYESMVEQLRKLNYTIEYEIFFTDNKSSFLKLFKILKKKESVFIYIDEVVSFGDKSEKNTELISFMNRSFPSKTGVKYLAEKTNASIFLTSICSESNELTCQKLSCNNKSFNQIIFNELEKKIIKSPEKWMKWESLHKFGSIKRDIANKSKKFQKYKLSKDRFFWFEYKTKLLGVIPSTSTMIPLDRLSFSLLKNLPEYVDVDEEKYKKTIVEKLFIEGCFDESVV